ncbi:hypothetical protein V496_02148 [Pseudogymnoascus sp. VKM F-4515 (FW-2607)]|nr:hypothetical protein V496_02148 [Pseudogymnoascus sp. VKM F-4515 (FW-2607)]
MEILSVKLVGNKRKRTPSQDFQTCRGCKQRSYPRGKNGTQDRNAQCETREIHRPHDQWECCTCSNVEKPQLPQPVHTDDTRAETTLEVEKQRPKHFICPKTSLQAIEAIDEKYSLGDSNLESDLMTDYTDSASDTELTTYSSVASAAAKTRAEYDVSTASLGSLDEADPPQSSSELPKNSQRTGSPPPFLQPKWYSSPARALPPSALLSQSLPLSTSLPSQVLGQPRTNGHTQTSLDLPWIGRDFCTRRWNPNSSFQNCFATFPHKGDNFLDYEENGRMYHGYRKGIYMFPCDEAEKDRMDIFHKLFNVARRGALHSAPFVSNYDVHRVLDLGTGTGIWASDMAEKLFPQIFTLGDAISKRPGMALLWIQHVEIDFTPKCDDGSLPRNTALLDWLHHLMNATQEACKPMAYNTKTRAMLHFNSAYFPALVATRAQVAQRPPAMASLSRFGVVKSKPIVGGFNVFRDSFISLCEGLGVSTSVDRLQHIDHGNAASDDAWDRYEGALQSELHTWYGVESDLTAWHALCRAIGVSKKCDQCEQAVRKTHVNIVDIIDLERILWSCKV